MERASQVLLTFLLNSSWQIAMIAGAAAICDQFLRATTARCRHFLWVTALVTSLCFAFLACLHFSDKGPTLIRTQSQNVTSRPATPPPAKQLSPYPSQSVVSSPEEPAGALETTSSRLSINKNAAAVLIVAYLIVLMYRALRLFRAWRMTRNIAKDACSVEFPE